MADPTKPDDVTASFLIVMRMYESLRMDIDTVKVLLIEKCGVSTEEFVKTRALLKEIVDEQFEPQLRALDEARELRRLLALLDKPGATKQ